ncbi:addiction module protein [Fulvivirga ligni]|uniref:addiction module protein n=1 Tax=Fulvivirga ligni TaxID=2904246 RepID=UPI001F27BA55|nr:addiction module protein [Fulvivirga ligni]UII23459.1 addiction module protein [Fulvivirga ligni]
MDIKSIKIDLIHWLTELQDPEVLKSLHTFKSQHENNLDESTKLLLNERLAFYGNNQDDLIDLDDALNDLEKDL